MPALLGLLLVVLFWGGNFTATKLALAEIHPLAFTAVRFALGAVLLAGVVLARGGRLLPPPALRRAVLALGLVGNTVYQLFFIGSLARTTATNASLILAAMPTVVTVAAGLLGMETVTRRRLVGLAVATAGVALVIAARGLGGGSAAGDLLMLGAVACWTAYTLGLRALGGQHSALELTTWALLAGTPGLLLAGLPSLLRVNWAALSSAAWAGITYSTLLSLVAAYFLWSVAVQRLGPSRTALVSLLTPFVATTIAMLVLHERPGLVHLVGGLLIVGGVLLARATARADEPGEA